MLGQLIVDLQVLQFSKKRKIHSREQATFLNFGGNFLIFEQLKSNFWVYCEATFPEFTSTIYSCLPPKAESVSTFLKFFSENPLPSDLINLIFCQVTLYYRLRTLHKFPVYCFYIGSFTNTSFSHHDFIHFQNGGKWRKRS